MMPVHFCPSDKAPVLIAWGRRKHQNHQGECHTEVSNINIDTVKFFFFSISDFKQQSSANDKTKEEFATQEIEGQKCQKGKI